MPPWADQEAYRINKARRLLQPALDGLQIEEPSLHWADLGCGDGIFTSALYTLLPRPNELYPVDKNRRALAALTRNFAESYPQAVLHPQAADFTHPLDLPPMDGLVMANALHFIPYRHQLAVLTHLTGLLKPDGRLILVEYNARRGNYAVPYPLDEDCFLALATEAGLLRAAMAAKIPSTFLGEMYAGLAFAP